MGYVGVYGYRFTYREVAFKCATAIVRVNTNFLQRVFSLGGSVKEKTSEWENRFLHLFEITTKDDPEKSYGYDPKKQISDSCVKKVNDIELKIPRNSKYFRVFWDLQREIEQFQAAFNLNYSKMKSTIVNAISSSTTTAHVTPFNTKYYKKSYNQRVMTYFNLLNDTNIKIREQFINDCSKLEKHFEQFIPLENGIVNACSEMVVNNDDSKDASKAEIAIAKIRKATQLAEAINKQYNAIQLSATHFDNQRKDALILLLDIQEKPK